jgi:hypothetical protein
MTQVRPNIAGYPWLPPRDAKKQNIPACSFHNHASESLTGGDARLFKIEDKIIFFTNFDSARFVPRIADAVPLLGAVAFILPLPPDPARLDGSVGRLAVLDVLAVAYATLIDDGRFWGASAPGAP